jgi:hypothetical protein
MIRSLFIARGALLCALVAGAGCHHHRARHPAPAAPPDSLHGIVAVTGASLEQRLVLRSGELAVYLKTSAEDSAALHRIPGVQVLVRGKSDSTVFSVTNFTVTHVDSVPALDGVLRTDDGVLVLETKSGRVKLGNPPPAMRSLIGARVWITGQAATGPLVYGVITPP